MKNNGTMEYFEEVETENDKNRIAQSMFQGLGVFVYAPKCTDDNCSGRKKIRSMNRLEKCESPLHIISAQISELGL